MQLGHGVVLITGGDLETVFDHGISASSRGGLYSFDLYSFPAADPIRIRLFTGDGEIYPTAEDQGTGFQAHGAFLSNSTDRLYVVVHRLGVSSIEIFDVRYRQEAKTNGMGGENLAMYGVAGELVPPVSLTHVRSVTSERFPAGGINDVVEGNSNDELFVTRWRVFGFPRNGTKGAKSIVEWCTNQLTLIIGLLGPSVTQVFRCTTKDGCTDATAKHFAGANGLAISPDRNTL